jgi:thiol-disulfide isomerase/thioredoxin
VVAYVQLALRQGDLATAAALVKQYRNLNGDTPEALEALSWLARGQAASGNMDEAMKEVREIQTAAQTSLATRKLDAEPHLPLALGAAYEVEADFLNQQNKRPQALQLLRSGVTKWRDTSIVDRLQKNINLLTLQQRPMPLLQQTSFIGPKPALPNAWRGKPLLLFFWAHWCADCKAEAPIISRLAQEFEPRGLVVIAPTRLYGYTAAEDDAKPDAEKAFIQRVFETYYSGIPKIQAPLDSGNFERFGASTTPTIVLVDRRGIVQLYHPGVMDEASLRAAIEQTMSAGSLNKQSPRIGR